MNLKSTCLRIGALLTLFAASGCDFLQLVPIVRNSKYFHIAGDVVDEQGNPVDGGMTVWEGNYISIVSENEFGYREVPTPNGKFDIRAGPCDGVTLGFGGEGLQDQQLGFGFPGNLPPTPLHVILHKYVPTVPVKFDPVGSFEMNAADLHFSHMSWSTLVLSINADGTAATVTTMADHKTLVRGIGTWRFTLAERKDVITLLVKQPDGAPNPVQISGQPIILELTGGDDANNHLNSGSLHLSFTRLR